MSDEKTLNVEGFPRISFAAARRVVDAYEAHERAREFALALKEREAYALAVRSTGQHTLDSLLKSAADIPLTGPYQEVRFDFGDSPVLRHDEYGRYQGDVCLCSHDDAVYWAPFLLTLKQADISLGAPVWFSEDDASCGISGISLEDCGRLVILHTSYVRKGGNGAR